MARKDPKESDYYPIVLKYLAQKEHCLTHSYTAKGDPFNFISRGQGQLIVDVYGLRGSTDLRNRQLEGIAVEVKRKQTGTSLRYIQQAAQYGELAHRCYLAQPFDFTLKVRAEAARVGVGLLRIHQTKIELIAESRRFEPAPAALARFLTHSLRLSECAVCGCFRFRHEPMPAGEKNGGGHWRRDDLTLTNRKTKLMFICEDCEQHWTRQNEFKKLETRLKNLEKRMERMKTAHNRLKAKL